MRVLVIGGTRFVGYQLAWDLVLHGHAVTVLNRGTLDARLPDSVTRLVADRTDLDAARRALDGRTFDATVDFAVYDGADASGAVELLRGRTGHYVMISTGQVYLVRTPRPAVAREADYGGPVMGEPADERERREWAYGIGKRHAEDVLARAFGDERFPATRLRIPMVNGEKDHFRRVESYFWRFADGGPVLVPRSLDRPTRHVYGRAVARAVRELLGDSGSFGEAFNLAQDETPTVSELLALIGELAGARGPVVVVDDERLVAAGLDPHAISPFSTRWMSFLDPAKARTRLAFRHEPLPDYLASIVRSLIDHPPASPPANYANRARELALM